MQRHGRHEPARCAGRPWTGRRKPGRQHCYALAEPTAEVEKSCACRRMSVSNVLLELATGWRPDVALELVVAESDCAGVLMVTLAPSA